MGEVGRSGFKRVEIGLIFVRWVEVGWEWLKWVENGWIGLKLVERNSSGIRICTNNLLRKIFCSREKCGDEIFCWWKINLWNLYFNIKGNLLYVGQFVFINLLKNFVIVDSVLREQFIVDMYEWFISDNILFPKKLLSWNFFSKINIFVKFILQKGEICVCCQSFITYFL